VEGNSAPVKPPEIHHFWSRIALGLAVVLLGFIGGALAIRLYDQNLNNSSGGQLQLAADDSQTVADLADKLGPSVVSIKVEVVQRGGFFLDQFYTQEGQGTGLIVDTKGLVLTNRHVIPDNITKVSLVLADGTIYDEVEVVDRDPLNDIAFLQIKNPGDDLIAAPLGDSSQVRVGDGVIAIGNALGEFSNTVTAGIISGLGRPIVAGDGPTAEQLQNLFQTDAAINPGNSGGPLVNLAGQVIGVNTAVAGGAENIGFAIPINDVKPALASVLDSGRIIRPFLGVRYVSLTPAIAKEIGLKPTQGAYLIGSGGQPAIVAGSPADKAGLKAEDIITKINGQVVNGQNPLSSRLGSLKVGDNAVLTVVRGEQEQTVEVTLEEAQDS